MFVLHPPPPDLTPDVAGVAARGSVGTEPTCCQSEAHQGSSSFKEQRLLLSASPA